ncbi:tyrosine-type recombinase/integrase [Actinomadura luteofluorescens]|uniref:tyrosine-type recombinase/integrase n=1 Tax=Actinomadura luteofluorescens TaxID=46163 RepID=UPI003D8DEF0C
MKATSADVAFRPYGPDITSFRRYLRAENKSARTTTIYVQATEKFAGWLIEHTDCVDWGDVESRDVQDFTIEVLDTRSAGYANNLYRAIQHFFRWWSAEYDLPNPMWGLEPSTVTEKLVPVLSERQLQALLRTVKGKTFTERRDAAILLLHHGCRAEESRDIGSEAVRHRSRPPGGHRHWEGP